MESSANIMLGEAYDSSMVGLFCVIYDVFHEPLTMQPKYLPCARLVSLSFHQSILLYISIPLPFSISPSLPLFSISQSLTYYLYNLHHFIYFPVSTSLYHFSVISITIITLSFLYISISISISPYFSRYLFFLCICINLFSLSLHHSHSLAV